MQSKTKYYTLWHYLLLASMLLLLCIANLLAQSNNQINHNLNNLADQSDHQIIKNNNNYVLANNSLKNIKIDFERISIEQGLSQASISSIFQDHYGYMWFGSYDGLNRYDGYKFVVYKNNPGENNTLSSNTITAIFEDHNGIMWIGTEIGLNSYNPLTKKFTTYQINDQDACSMSYNFITAIFEDRSNNLWIGTHKGLNRYNREKHCFTVYLDETDSAHSLIGRSIRSIYQDNNGTLWIGTSKGLNRYNPQTDSFINYKHNPKDPDSIQNGTVTAIYLDEKRQLWIGTDEGGVSRFNEQTQKFIKYFAGYDNNSYAITNRRISAICGDQKGQIWIASDKGLIRYDPQTEIFTAYRNDPANANSLSSDYIYSIYLDRTGILWFGTSIGLSKFDAKSRRFTPYRIDASVPIDRSGNYFYSIYEDSRGEVWVVGFNKTLYKFDPISKTVKTELNESPEFEKVMKDLVIISLVEDRQNRLWFATFKSGLHCYDLKTKKLTSYYPNAQDPDSISSEFITNVYSDEAGMLWLPTDNGLNIYDPAKNKFILDPISKDRQFALISVIQQHSGNFWLGTYFDGLKILNQQHQLIKTYRHEDNNLNSLSDNRVNVIYETKSGTLWVGTRNGLNRFNTETNNFTVYTEKDGLPNNVVYGILEDDENNIWISTNKGLSKFSADTNKFQNYDVGDGLQSNEFNMRACFKNSRGELYFAGINGFNKFVSRDIIDNRYIPPIVITSFKINDKTNSITEQVIIEATQNQQQDFLKLNYQQNFLSFEFAALNFTHAEKNQYKYKLEGLDSDWITKSEYRYANYTNLVPGEYIFRVIGSNNDGQWNNNGIAIKIRIEPPPWRTWWAYTIYLMIIIVISLIIYRSYMHKIAEQTRLREIQLRAQAAEFANQSKSVFLANMSHEVRTPLNAVLGFAQVLQHNPSLNCEAQAHIEIILRSGEFLLALINDVLSLSKIEAGKIALKDEPFNPHNLLKDLVQIFQARAEAKSLKFHCEIAPSLPQVVLGDEGKLRQILINLLGNAIKFTEQGTIQLSVQWQAGRANFAIKDTGVGIAETENAKLFQPFSQTESGQRLREGVGLGLSISRTFARLMKGDITFVSEVNKGSCFICDIALPVSDAKNININYQAGRVIGLVESELKYRILIVDDRWENRVVLKSLLEIIGFEIREASNGQEALECWREWKPNLIWMDMRMQVMDGYQATRAIRAEYNDQLDQNNNGAKKYLRPIIIALTANVFEQDHAKIYQAGCDDIVIKPYLEKTILDKLIEHLGVQYIYQSSNNKSESGSGSLSNDQLRQRLSKLSPDLMEQLSLAILEGRTAIVTELITVVEQQDKVLGDELNKRLKAFRLDELAQLLEKS